MEPRTLDHVALWVADRDPIADFLTRHVGMHVVDRTERFTLVDRDTIKYEFTVDDRRTWTQPWSGEVPMRRIDGPIYEYGCHEGNYGLENILRAARVQEANAR